MRKSGWLALVLLLTAGIYAQLFSAPYLVIDDSTNIFANSYFLTGNWLALWTTPYYGMYVPVTSSIWAVLFNLGGGAVWPFRVLNLLLHLLNAVLVYKLIRLKFPQAERRLNAVFAAGLFALHPLQVAAVAWISGGRDLLSAFFCLAAVWISAGKLSLRRLLGATLLFVFALLSKPNVVAAPVALMLLIGAQGTTSLAGGRRRVSVLVGWTLLALVCVLWTVHGQDTGDVVPDAWYLRPLVALDTYGFYLGKILLPLELAADYGRTSASLWAAPQKLALTIPLGLIGIGAGFLIRDIWAWFLLMIPVAGLVPFAYQLNSNVADHYPYLSMAVVALVFVRLYEFVRLDDRFGDRVRSVAGAAALLLLALLSLSRTQVWKNDQVFLEDMHRQNPQSFLANANLALMACTTTDGALRGLQYIAAAQVARPHDLQTAMIESQCLYRLGRVREILVLEKEWLTSERLEKLRMNEVASSALIGAISAAHLQLAPSLDESDRMREVQKAFTQMCFARLLNPTEPSYGQNLEVIRAMLRAVDSSIECPKTQSFQQIFELSR